jgi:hypothetical protein
VTYVPPQPPSGPTGHGTAEAADPEGTDLARVPSTSAAPPDPASGLGGAADPANGVRLAIVAVILGALGCVGSLTPVVLDEWREDLALTFGVPGLLVGIIACVRRRGGDPLAVTGLVLSVIALGLADRYRIDVGGRHPLQQVVQGRLVQRHHRGAQQRRVPSRVALRTGAGPVCGSVPRASYVRVSTLW